MATSSEAEAVGLLQSEPFELLVLQEKLPDGRGQSFLEKRRSGAAESAELSLMALAGK